MKATRPQRPTLWRTCRVLANRTRLCLLDSVLRHPGYSVTDLASHAGISVTHASRGLRALNARGLIRADRRLPWVCYTAATDHSVPAAGLLLPALAEMLGHDQEAADRIFHLVTGFTDPRRIAIIRELRDGPVRAAEIGRRLRISRPAMDRHLRKLRDRGFVVAKPHGYRLTRPHDALRRALLRIACQ